MHAGVSAPVVVIPRLCKDSEGYLFRNSVPEIPETGISFPEIPEIRLLPAGIPEFRKLPARARRGFAFSGMPDRVPIPRGMVYIERDELVRNVLVLTTLDDKTLFEYAF